MKMFSHKFSIIFSIILLNSIVSFYCYYVYNQLNGIFIYPLDDAYIHLQIAKNFALHHNWGINSNEFSSTSSSPLYTIILAFLIKCFGLCDYYPLVINLIFGNLILVVTYIYFKTYYKSYLSSSIFTIFLITPTLLAIQIISGMEHTLHIFVVLTVLYLFDIIVKKRALKIQYILFFFVVFTMSLVRYESMFILAGFILVFALKKQYKLSLITLVLMVISVSTFGIYSINHGSYFFPNSLLIKANLFTGTDLVLNYIKKIGLLIMFIPITIPIIILLCSMIVRESKINFLSIHTVLNFITRNFVFFVVLFTIVIHFTFSAIGWLYRYEAYLLAMLYVVGIIYKGEIFALFKIRKYKYLYMFLCLVLIYSIGHRTIQANHTILNASKNIHDQQYQIAQFLSKYYNNSKIMANDIGIITYKTDIELLDIYGLGSKDVLDFKRSNSKNWAAFLSKSPYNQYDIIIIYDSWFLDIDKSKLHWTKVAETTIKNNEICGNSTVSLYSSNNLKTNKLKSDLKKFQRELPKDVILKIY